MLSVPVARDFRAIPGVGVSANIDGAVIAVGRRAADGDGNALMETEGLDAEGKSLLFIARDSELVGILAASDIIRPEVRRRPLTARDRACVTSSSLPETTNGLRLCCSPAP